MKYNLVTSNLVNNTVCRLLRFTVTYNIHDYECMQGTFSIKSFIVVVTTIYKGVYY